MNDEYEEYTTRQSVPVAGLNDVSEPLRGVVICCTSIPDEKRTELAAFAVQMGAIHKYDLTPDVTHLIIGDYNTPKYRFVAKERPDVEPMAAAWIEAVRELWINDQEIDFDALQQEHKLPVFSSLRFSMTGCEDPAERLDIAEKVKANGATYEGDLTKSITHLISFRTEGAKYKAARLWSLKVVSVEWMRDSMERGMILDETLYDPTIAVEKRGVGAWDRNKPKRTSLGKRSREDSNAVQGGKRRLRRTASTKLNSQSEGIWGDIVGGNMVAQVARSGVWEVDDSTIQAVSSEPKLKEQKQSSNRPPSFHTIAEKPPVKKGIFGGCRFYMYGFVAKQTEILHGHLVSNDGEISHTAEDLVSCVDSSPPRLFRIVPHDLQVSSYPELPNTELLIETVTLWWVEGCLHHKRFQEPGDHVIGRPFPVFPIEGFSDGTMSIASSAFSGIDLRHLKLAVQLIGAVYSEDMTPKSSVLITKSITAVRKDKFDHAQEWKIPIVTANWLWDSISTNKRLSFSKYRCRPQKRSGSLPNTGALPSADHFQSGRSKNVHPKSSNATINPEPFEDRPSKQAGEIRSEPTIDHTAFDGEHIIERATKKDAVTKDAVIKKESLIEMGPPPNASSSTDDDASCKTEPLSERSLNSPSRTVSTAPAPSCHPAPPPPPDLSNEISDLLSKAKATGTDTTPRKSTETRKRTNRILGRATSGGNISVGSSSLSRATSVDSNATSGHHADYPPALRDQASNERMEMLLNNEDRNRTNADETQPSMTQLQYLDTDAIEAREMVMARMMGENLDGVRRRNGLKEKAVTLGDLMGTINAGKRTTRRSGGKERGR